MSLRILKAFRPVVLAAGLVLFPALLGAQTLIVRGAPAGQNVELFVNATQAASGTTDERGDAVIEWKLAAAEMDARVFVDICGDTHRVMLMDRNLLPRPQEAGCERRDVVGVFWLRRNSTLVVNVARAIPSVMLRQTDVTIEQLDTPPTRRTVPTGVVVFGGVGGAAFRDVFNTACGNAAPCDGPDSGLGWIGGAELWLARQLSVEASFIRTPRPEFEGGEGTFVFESQFEPTIVFTVAGKVAAPIGPVRLYGKGGGIYHRQKFTTQQSMAGETLSMAFETRGWGWTAGGGIEGWINRSLGLYLEATTSALKGTDPGAGEARIDDRLNTLFAGIRLRVLGGR